MKKLSNFSKLLRLTSLGFALILGSLLLASPLRATEGPELEVPSEELEKDFLHYEEGHGIRVGDKLSFFGYGELHYNNPLNSSADRFDMHRMVIGVGVDFTDWLIFRTEIDFEHAATEIELEFAYLDFLLSDLFNVRAGSILMPIGFLNNHHEPTLYYSVERPQFDTVIIPTTWQAAGVGFHGETPFGLGYELYVMESLDAVGDGFGDGFRGDRGLRQGRRHTAEAPGRDIAGMLRLDYKGIQGLQLGTSVWVGNTGQGNATVGGGLTTILTGDVRYQLAGFELTATGAWIHIGDAAGINAAIQAIDPATAFTNFVASDIIGYYGELAYHVFHHAWPDSPYDLVVFGRHERYNTQHKMPTGFARNVANERNTTTLGLAFYPIKNVALKLDYNINRNAAGTANDQLNAGFAFMY